jgi:hypothetical protein
VRPPRAPVATSVRIWNARMGVRRHLGGIVGLFHPSANVIAMPPSSPSSGHLRQQCLCLSLGMESPMRWSAAERHNTQAKR